jgi:hypothetical protein
MSEDDNHETQSAVLAEPERIARRAAARRRRQLQRRRLAAAAVAVLGLAAVVAALSGSGGSKGSKAHTGSSVKRPPAIVPGGPLAPAAVGGLASLWAPTNVVGAQPGTAAAYEAASKLSQLPGYLMIADRGNNRILVVDPAQKIVFKYPGPGDRGKLFYDDDTFIEPGGESIIANEEDNHAIVQLQIKTRTLSVLFGHPEVRGSDSTHVNTPDDAYMLPDGTFTVADAGNCRILFIRARQIVRSYGHTRVCRHEPPRYLGEVNGDTPVPGGGVMVSEVQGNWIDEIGPEGKLKWAVRAPVSYPSDPQPLAGGRVLLADYASPGHVLIINRQNKVLWRYGPVSGPGRLDHPSLAMGLPNGDVAVNDDYRHRVVIIDPRTNTIVWQYGHTDRAGTAPGFLDTPDGMDFIPAAPDGTPDYAAVVHP